jgi:NTE family protein
MITFASPRMCGSRSGGFCPQEGHFTSAGTSKRRIGIVLSGYAPAMTLMSGAMLGFMDKGIEFDAISTSGPGALVGLLAIAPNRNRPREALEDLPNLYTGDLLHKLLPLNVRLAIRNSPFSKPIQQLREILPRFDVKPDESAPMKRLFNDWMYVALDAMTPGFELDTPGMLNHSPLLHQMIDFDKLHQALPRFYLSAFNLNKLKIDIFDRKTTTLEHFLATQSTPFFYPPQYGAPYYQRGGDLFYSGICHDATGLQAIWLEERQKLDMVLAFEPITEANWREPTDLVDAFKLMRNNPIVALETVTQWLYAGIDHGIEANGDDKRELPRRYRIPIPLGDYPRTEILKWTHSNAIALQRIGRRAAAEFADVLLSGDKGALEQRRFGNTDFNNRNDQVGEFLSTLLKQVKTPTTRLGDPADTGGYFDGGSPRGDVPFAVWQKRITRVGVLLGGGAPEMQLTAGALCTFAEKKFSFDVISASGAGALPGLQYVGPAVPGSQEQVLRQSVNLHIVDAIEHVLPYNYKVFFKPGPFAPYAWRLGQSLHFDMRADERSSSHLEPLKRLYNDSIDLMISIMTPTTLNFRSKAMCRRVGMLDKVIAWDRLADYPKQFYLNAFNLETQRLESFDKSNLTPDSFWAALAMPWLFDPVKIGAATYTEGASHDPSGLAALLLRWDQDEIRGLTEIIAFDTLGEELWSNPETLYEALQVMIMEPIVTLAELIQVIYGYLEWLVNDKHWFKNERPLLPKLYRLAFEMPDWEVRNVLRWDHANALRLWHVGHSSAEKFWDAREKGDECYEKYRYYPSIMKDPKKGPRVRELLELLDNYLEILNPDFKASHVVQPDAC